MLFRQFMKIQITLAPYAEFQNTRFKLTKFTLIGLINLINIRFIAKVDRLLRLNTPINIIISSFSESHNTLTKSTIFI